MSEIGRFDVGLRGVMITALLILHAILAVTLLGAITHQAISVWLPHSAGLLDLLAAIARARGPS